MASRGEDVTVNEEVLKFEASGTPAAEFISRCISVVTILLLI